MCTIWNTDVGRMLKCSSLILVRTRRLRVSVSSFNNVPIIIFMLITRYVRCIPMSAQNTLAQEKWRASSGNENISFLLIFIVISVENENCIIIYIY